MQQCFLALHQKPTPRLARLREQCKENLLIYKKAMLPLKKKFIIKHLNFVKSIIQMKVLWYVLSMLRYHANFLTPEILSIPM